MPTVGGSDAPAKLEGKYAAVVLCWILGIGSLMSWNSMLTIEDYYSKLFPRYHPTRVLTLVYQSFAFGTIIILAYHEAKINIRNQNLFGYDIFFIASLMVLVLDLATSVKGGIGPFIGLCAISAYFRLTNANVQGGMVGDLIFMSPAMMQRYHPTRVLTLVYQPFAFGTIIIFSYHEAKINTRNRNLFGYGLFFIASLMVLVLNLATFGKGGIGPFIGLCAISACFGLADANVQGGMVGDLAFMSPTMMQSFIAGLAASGALTSVLRLITKAAYEDSQDDLRQGALVFFGITSFLELVCVLLYAFTFPKLPIVKYFRSKAASEGSKTVSADLAAGGIQTLPSQDEEDPKLLERLTIKELLHQNIDYAFDLFLIYMLTLSIFPGFLSEDTGSHSLGSWYVVVLIAMYNVWNLIGRYVPLIKGLMIESRKGLMIVILSRFLFVPAFYFTAKYGTQGWMIMLTSLLGLTNGYLTVSILTVAPKGYKGPEQNALGNLLVLFMLGGIFAGVSLDWLWLIGKGW